MKKLISVLCLCTIVALAGCGKSNSKYENVNLTNSNVQEEKDKNDTSSSPSKADFQTVPDEGEKALDQVVEVAKESFKDSKGKLMYGYQGEQKINNVECYIFTVYSGDNDTYTELGTFAVVKKTDALYQLNKDTNKFEIVEQEADKTSSWADTQTESFAKYLSSNKSSADENSKQLEESSEAK